MKNRNNQQDTNLIEGKIFEKENEIELLLYER